MEQVLVRVARESQLRKEHDRRMRLVRAAGQRQRAHGALFGIAEANVRNPDRYAREAVTVDGLVGEVGHRCDARRGASVRA